MNEIKCPNCGTIFQINETDYDKIVKQIKNQEYDKEIKELENRYKKDKEHHNMYFSAAPFVGTDQWTDHYHRCTRCSDPA